MQILWAGVLQRKLAIEESFGRQLKTAVNAERLMGKAQQYAKYADGDKYGEKVKTV